MTGDLLDMANREARDRLHCAGRPARPRLRAYIYARAIMRLVEVGRCEGEDFYDAYRRVRARPCVTVVALLLTYRDQFERERRALMH